MKAGDDGKKNNNEGAYNAYLKRLVGALVVQMANVEVERFDAVTANMLKQHEARKFRLPRLIIRTLAETHTPIALSGSPEVLVRPFVADLNFASIYGSSYEVEDGKFTGMAQSIGNKAMLLKQLVDSGVVLQEGSIAMGDTYGDVPMLEYAQRAIMFEASHTLTTYGEDFGWDKAFDSKDRITILRKSPDLGVYVENDLDDYLDSLKSIA